MGVLGNGHIIVEPPTPTALPAEKVIDQSLHDLPKAPGLTRYRIRKCFIPARPSIFLGNRRGGLQEHSTSGQSRGDIGTQLSGERGNGLFDTDVSPVHLLGPEKVREFLENVLTDHGMELLSY